MSKRSNRSGLLSWTARHRVVILSVLRFAVAVIVATTVLTQWGKAFFPATERATAWLTGVGLQALGMDPVVTGTHIQVQGFSLAIISECTGVLPAIIFLIGVLAAPFRWRSRISGIFIGVPALILLNWIRMVSLSVVGVHFPAEFDTIHLVVWQPLYVFATAVLWFAWAWHAHRHHGA